MANLWKNLCYAIGSHKVAAIATASVVGVGAVGAGGYAGYQYFHEDTVAEVDHVEIEDEDTAAAVEMPEFKSIKISSDSVEKDLTIYFADETDECITGTQFSIKLIKPEDAAQLNTFVTAIQDINKQIVEYTGQDILDTGEPKPQADESKNESSEGDESTGDAQDTEGKALAPRPVQVTVTDEEGEVVKVVDPKPADDPVYQLNLDKEVALQAYYMALNDVEGQIYVDDDADGIISEKDINPGDYVVCLLYNESWDMMYDPSEYSAPVNVKDKVEYKVVKEITKKVEKDKPAEDGQKKEATPVENVLADTVEYVESSKVEKSKSVKEAKAVKPTGTTSTGSGKKSTATKKSGDPTVTNKKGNDYKITIHYQDATTKKAIQKDEVKTFTAEENAEVTVEPSDIAGYTKPASQKVKAVSNKTLEVTFLYTKTSDTQYTVTIVCECGADKKEVKDQKFKDGATITAPAWDGYESPSPASVVYNNATHKGTVKFTYTKTAAKTYPVTIHCVSGSDKKDVTGSSYKDGDTITAPTWDGYKDPSPATITYKHAEHNGQVTFNYTKVPTEPTKHDVTINCKGSDGATKTSSGKYADGDTITAPTWDGYKDPSPASYTYSNSNHGSAVEFTYTKIENTPAPENGEGGDSNNNALPVALRTKSLLFATKIKTASNTTAVESATLDIKYSAGVFTVNTITKIGDQASNKISVTRMKVRNVKTGADTALTSGQTYTVTANGDYTFSALVTFTNGEQKAVGVTYTVAGYGTDDTTPLKDAAGHELYIDKDCKTKAYASDYKDNQTYYYVDAAYEYRGWQNINGLSYYYDKNGNVVTGKQVIQGVQYNFGTDGALVVNGTGIDVSKYQKKIDWKSAKSAVSFAIVRCGYRGMYDGQLHADPYFYENMSGAKAAGVATGVYIYSTALTEAEAVEEASAAVAMANKAGGCTYPIYIDMEDSVRGVNKLTNEQRTAIINAFCTTVQSGGYKAGVYANRNWMTSYINTSSLSSSCYIWVAQYNTSCSYSGKYSMWQYSSKGSVPGISGFVDMNKSFF